MVEREMTGRPILVVAAAAFCWVTASGYGPACADNSSSGLDDGGALDRTSTIMPTASLVLDPPAAGEGASTEQRLGTNPLWGIPIELLNVTRERPLFSPSRRPPASAARSAPVKIVGTVRPVAAPKPALNLVGTVAGNREAYAVFVNTTTHSIVRLRMGEGEDGWVLRSVGEREVILYKDDRTEVLQLPATTGLPDK
jgi:general secretion pathway protein N